MDVLKPHSSSDTGTINNNLEIEALQHYLWAVIPALTGGDAQALVSVLHSPEGRAVLDRVVRDKDCPALLVHLIKSEEVESDTNPTGSPEQFNEVAAPVFISSERKDLRHSVDSDTNGGTRKDRELHTSVAESDEHHTGSLNGKSSTPKPASASVDAFRLSFDWNDARNGVCTAAFVRQQRNIRLDRPMQEQFHVVVLPSRGVHVSEVLQLHWRSFLQPAIDFHHQKIYNREDFGVSTRQEPHDKVELFVETVDTSSLDVPHVEFALHPRIQDAEKNSKRKGSTLTIREVEGNLKDTKFLNELQRLVSSWTRSIMDVTDMRLDAWPSSVHQEMDYWTALQNELDNIDMQLKSPSVEVTLAIVRQRGKAIEAEKRLTEAKKEVAMYQHMLREFPICKLPSSGRMSKLSSDLKSAFKHMRQRASTMGQHGNMDTEPNNGTTRTGEGAPQRVNLLVHRSLGLAVAIGRDMRHLLVESLIAMDLMQAPYEEFQNAVQMSTEVLETLEEEAVDYGKFVAETCGTSSLPQQDFIGQIGSICNPLKNRLRLLQTLRRQHQQLAGVLEPALAPFLLNFKYRGMEHDLAAALRILATSDALKSSPDNPQLWAADLAAHQRCVRAVEDQIVLAIRGVLRDSSASSRLRILHGTCALLARPQIRETLLRDWTGLVRSLQVDLRRLKGRYAATSNSPMELHAAILFGVSNVPGAVMETLHIQRWLAEKTRWLQDLLAAIGDDVEAQNLISQMKAFHSQLDAQKLLSRWQKEAEGSGLELTGPVLDIVPDGAENGFKVRYNPKLEQFAKDVRSLQGLGCPIPHSLLSLAFSAHEALPSATTLEHVLYCVSRLRAALPSEAWLLVDESWKEMDKILREGLDVDWDMDEESLEAYVTRVCEAFELLENRIMAVSRLHFKAKEALAALASCPYQELPNAVACLQEVTLEVEGPGSSSTALHIWAAPFKLCVTQHLWERATNALFTWLTHYSKEQLVSPSHKVEVSERNGTEQDLETSHGRQEKRSLNPIHGSREGPQVFTPPKSVDRSCQGEENVSEFSMTKDESIPAFKKFMCRVVVSYENLEVSPPLVTVKEALLDSLGSLLAVVFNIPKLDIPDRNKVDDIDGAVSEGQTTEMDKSELSDELEQSSNGLKGEQEEKGEKDIQDVSRTSSEVLREVDRNHEGGEVMGQDQESSTTPDSNVNKVICEGELESGEEIKKGKRKWEKFKMQGGDDIDEQESVSGKRRANSEGGVASSQDSISSMTRKWHSGAALQGQWNHTYWEVMEKLPGTLLHRAFEVVDETFLEAQQRIQIWAQYNGQTEQLHARLKTLDKGHLVEWLELYASAEKLQQTIDRQNGDYQGSSLTVDFSLVKASMSTDLQVTGDLLKNKIAGSLVHASETILEQIEKSRHILIMLCAQLDEPTFSGDNMNDLVSFKQVLEQVPNWQKTVALIQQGINLLDVVYWDPSNWDMTRAVAGKWKAFLEELEEKEGHVQSQLPVLRRQLNAQQASISEGIQMFSQDWSVDKPDSVNQQPNHALSILHTFEQRLAHLFDKVQKLTEAEQLILDIQKSLDLVSTIPLLAALEKLKDDIDELGKSWAGLEGIWSKMEMLNSSPLLKTDQKFVSSQLEMTEGKLSEFLGRSQLWKSSPSMRSQSTSPIDRRQLFSFAEPSLVSPVAPQPQITPATLMLSHVAISWHERVSKWMSDNHILQELKSAPLRDWHWESLLTRLGLRHVPLEEITLGNLWNIQLSRYEAEVRATIQECLGQMAVEQFLSRVEGEWKQKNLDIVRYNGSDRTVVRGLDEHMGLISEHLGMLGTVKTSPYLGPWEREATNLETMLSKLGRLLEALSTVQQSWVQLEGMFGNSGDAVCQQLPEERSNFSHVDTEFKRLMARLNRKPQVSTLLEDLNLEGLLDGMGQTLKLVTERLHAFLEQQREAFPRFYFLGDDDLLTLLGNPKDLAMIQRHLRKLFVGIASLRVVKKKKVTMITAVVSPEGEEVVLTTPISFDTSQNEGASGVTDVSTPPAFEDSVVPSPLRDTSEGAAAVLTTLEAAVRSTLINLLLGAFQELQLLEGWWASCNGQTAAAVGMPDPCSIPLDSLKEFLAWTIAYPLQVVVLALQVQWTAVIEAILDPVSSETRDTENERGKRKQALVTMARTTDIMLEALAGGAAEPGSALSRRRLQVVITVLVHQRDTLRRLVKLNVEDATDFAWLACTRLYLSMPKRKSEQESSSGENLHQGSDQEEVAHLLVCMADARFNYGFEYLGQAERLVQTELTDRCFLAVSQALKWGQGAALSGPAGTGKTETIKALGAQLGRFVVVFNCDRHFDLQALCRLLAGLARIGAWGCFDEFNRLEERILSAVSQQILAIQEGLKQHHETVDVLGRAVPLHPSTGIFVTMNPRYAGRQHLPDNLQALLRSVTLSKPDAEAIIEVLLFVQGFRTAQKLASKLVLLFQMAQTELSDQLHYDFSLRALKGTVSRAGLAKRRSFAPNNLASNPPHIAGISSVVKVEVAAEIGSLDSGMKEAQLLVDSVWGEMAPKLTGGDEAVFQGLLGNVFPGTHLQLESEAALFAAIRQVLLDWELEEGQEWLEKTLHLAKLVEVHEGVLLVGPTSAGKTTAWRVVLEALGRVKGVHTTAHVIDPKSLKVEEIYGKLDSSTREWKDGIFTSLLRQVIGLVHGDNDGAGSGEGNGAGGLSSGDGAVEEATGLHWLVFDGDVDPDWVENLNSVLDDNKMLVLPNGERLRLPSCVRCIFEAESIRHATPATVSRLGMLYFSSATLSLPMVMARCRNRLSRGVAMHPLQRFGHLEPENSAEGNEGRRAETVVVESTEVVEEAAKNDIVDLMHEVKQQVSDSHVTGSQLPDAETRKTRRKVCQEILLPFLEEGGLVQSGIEKAMDFNHVMTYVPMRALESALSLLDGSMAEWINHHDDSEKSEEKLHESAKSYLSACVLQALLWGAGSSMTQSSRTDFGNWLADSAKSMFSKPPVSSRSPETNLIDFRVKLGEETWSPWKDSVPTTEVELAKVGNSRSHGLVPTVDTTRHGLFLRAWLTEGRPTILCGPPGCGKSMIVGALVDTMPKVVQLTIKFSRLTTPSSLLNGLMQHCEIMRKRMRTDAVEYVLQPKHPDGWLVVFCNRINQPAFDTYGSQPVMALLRQLWERGGYWDPSRLAWVHVERIKWMASCISTSMLDNGSSMISSRFLRHSSLVAIDHPTVEALHQIYGAWSKALLEKGAPNLIAESQTVATAMVDIYIRCKQRSETGLHAPTVYSPRDLSRWMKNLEWAILKRQQAVSNLRTPIASSPAVSPLSVWSIARSPLLNEYDKPLQGSPNMLTGWSSGKEITEVRLDDFVRLWLHEGLRIWRDRLWAVEEKEWVDQEMDMLVQRFFPETDVVSCITRPIFYSTWLSFGYEPVTMPQLAEFLERQLLIFQERQAVDGSKDTPNANPGFPKGCKLLMSKDMAERVLQMSLVLQKPGGHLLVAGNSGTGKSTVAGFAAQLAGLQVVVAITHGGYTEGQLDVDLWALLRRAGCDGEEVCLLVDEAQELQPKALEKLHSLLAFGEIPGLIGDADFQIILKECDVAAKEEGESLESTEELYNFFVARVLKNLHVCLVMTATGERIRELAIFCPALLSDCVLHWCTPFSDDSLLEMAIVRAAEAMQKLHIPTLAFEGKDIAQQSGTTKSDLLRAEPLEVNKAMAGCLVAIHKEAVRVFNNLPPPLNTCATLASFQDLLQHFVTLFGTYHKTASQQLLHLEQGLSKVQTAEQELAELRVLLAEKGTELEQKRAEATLKLLAVESDQRLVEKQQSSANQLVSQVEQQKRDIGVRREAAQQVLAEAEPAVEEARSAVQCMKKAHLDDLRFMPNPPDSVKQTLEGVCLLLTGSKPTTWQAILSIVRRSDFIASILAFRLSSLSQSITSRIRADYLDNPNLSFSIVNRASRVCGPLYRWLAAVVEYGEILVRVQPLRDEVAGLEEEYNKMQQRLDASQARSRELKNQIAQLLEDHAVLGRQASIIAAEMKAASQKLRRAEALIDGVVQERARWYSEKQSLTIAIGSLAGKAALGAAFLAYLGPLDESQRSELMQLWESILVACPTLGTKPKMNQLADLVCTEDERLWWVGRGLPDDDMALQNASILGKSQRALLLVDPLGQMMEFFKMSLQAKWPKVGEVSAMDSESFVIGELECAARLGYPLIVRDVVGQPKALVPILCQLGSRRAAMQTVVQLGGREVFVASSFKLVLVARAGLGEVSESLCSKVLVLSAALTKAGLQNTLLSRIVRALRPEIEARRTEAQQLQGQYRMRITELERSLLSALSDSPVALVENESLLNVLENIKNEASALGKKAAEVEGALEQTHAARAHYGKLATACSRAFFALKELTTLSPLYQFSLSAFLDVFQYALAREKARVDGLHTVEGEERAEHFLLEILWTVLNRYSSSLQSAHHVPLGLRLAQAALEARESGPVNAEHLSLLAGQYQWLVVGAASTGEALDERKKGSSTGTSKGHSSEGEMWQGLEQLLTKRQRNELAKLFYILPRGSLLLEKFVEFVRAGDSADLTSSSGERQRGYPRAIWEKAVASLADFSSEHEAPGTTVECTTCCMRLADVQERTPCRSCHDKAILVEFIGLLVAIVVNPAEFKEKAMQFVAAVLCPRPASATGLPRGESSDERSVVRLALPNLSTFVLNESSSTRPVLLVCMPNCDPTADIAALAHQAHERGIRHFECIAMGSEDTLSLAEAAVLSAAREGQWVVLQNIHLASGWLPALEKLLRGAPSKGEFRLILTMEAAGQRAVPPSLVEASDVHVMEAPPGLRASLQRSLVLLGEERTLPLEALRVAVLLAWLHAVLLERLRYVPIGWFHRINFSDTDFRTALATVVVWLRASSTKGDNSHSGNIPWTSLTTLLIETVYGQKLESEQDREILRALVHRYLSPPAGSAGFTLTGPLPSLELPSDQELHISSQIGVVGSAVKLPEAENLQDYILWVENLPQDCPPEWLGLWAGAEDLRVGKECRRILADFWSLQIAGAQGVTTKQTVSSGMEVVTRKQTMSLGMEGEVKKKQQISPSSQPIRNAMVVNKRSSSRALASRPFVNEGSKVNSEGVLGMPKMNLDISQEMERWLTDLDEVGFMESKAEVSRGKVSLPAPIMRWLMREFDTGASLLGEVRDQLRAVLNSGILHTSLPHSLSKSPADKSYQGEEFMSITRQEVPQRWLQLNGQKQQSTRGPLGPWLILLRRRLLHLVQRCRDITSGKSKESEGGAGSILITGDWWLGGLFHPRSFLSACKQVASQVFHWPIEELVLSVHVRYSPDSDPSKKVKADEGVNPLIRVTGLQLQGCFWESGTLVLKPGLSSLSKNMTNASASDSVSVLPTVAISWSPSAAASLKENGGEGDSESSSIESNSVASQGMVAVPVFLDETRTTLLFFAKLRAKGSASSWLQQGAAILALGVL